MAIEGPKIRQTSFTCLVNVTGEVDHSHARNREAQLFPTERRCPLDLGTYGLAMREDLYNVLAYEYKVFDLPVAVDSECLVVEPLDPLRVLDFESWPWQLRLEGLD
jgi:hypothetical protein